MAVKLPAVPAVPRDASPATQRFLTALKEIVETREGTRASGTQRFVTVDEAIKLDQNRSSGRTGPFGTGTTGGASIKPPTNLSIQQTVYFHVLTWVNTTEDHLSHIEVWWNTTNDVSTSDLLAVVTKPITEFRNLVGADTNDRYYWIRSVSFDGTYSPWLPSTSQGGYLMAGKDTVGDMVDDVLASLKGGDQPAYDPAVTYAVGDLVLFNGRTWRRKDYDIGNSDVDPTNSMFWERVGILMQGDVDGIPTVGIDGNLAVDGSIMARHIAADQINGDHVNAQSIITLDEGGTAIFGNQNVVIDTATTGGKGRIMVAPDGGMTGNSYSELVDDDFRFWYYNPDTLEHELYQALRRFEMGTCDSGATVEIPGIWRNTPAVFLQPWNVPIYRSAYSAQDQNMRLTVSDLELIPQTTNRWRFTALADLLLAAQSGSIVLNNTVTGTPYDATLTGTTVTLPPNTKSLTVHARIKGCVGSSYETSSQAGENTYYYIEHTRMKVSRQVTLHAYYNNSWHTFSSSMYCVRGDTWTSKFFEVNSSYDITSFYLTSTAPENYWTPCGATAYYIGTDPGYPMSYGALNTYTYETDQDQTYVPIDQGTLTWFAFGN